MSSQQLGSRAMCFEPGISIKGPVYMAFNSNHSVSVIPAAGKLPIERLPDSKAVDQSPHKMKKKASDAEKKMASRHQAQRSRDSKKAAIADQEKRIKEMAKRMGSAIDLKEKKGEPCVTTEDEYKRRIDHWVKNPQRKHELKIVTTYSVDALSKWFVEADKAMAQGQRGKKIFTDLRGTDVDCQSIHQLHKAIKNQIFSAHSLAGQSHYQSCLNVIESELVTALANKGKASALLPDNPEPS
ncbi:MAG: hypothetical protein ACPG5T_01640 [Endozoicomonas sp.]